MNKKYDTFYDPSTWQASRVTIRGYCLLNAYASTEIMDGFLTLYAKVNNITNTKYTMVYGYQSEGTTYLIGAKASL